MKILKIKLFQETVCYKKPFAFKVAETYPLPPYSTVIGMFHKIIEAKSGEYFDMNISIQGDFDSIFNDYQNLRMYKGKGKVTSMPRNVHQLLDVNLIIHVEAEEDIINKIYNNLVLGKVTFTLGRNDDLVRVDEVKFIHNISIVNRQVFKFNTYVPMNSNFVNQGVEGINYRLNTKYVIDKDNLRKWEKTDVKYVDKKSGYLSTAFQDDDGDLVFFYK